MSADTIAASIDVTWLAMEAVIPSPYFPAPEIRTRRGTQRAEHLMGTDPGGCWVAVDDRGDVVGTSMALVREGVWALSQLAVHPQVQSRQVGRRLLDAALGHGDDVRGRLIASSTDPRALRRYRRAGLDLIPCVSASGALLARAIPGGLRSRPASLPDDQALCDHASRRVRGAAHGSDVAALIASHGDTALVHDDGGWAVARDGSPMLLAALDEDVARDLLWSAFASGPRGGSVHVGNISARQQWAIDVCLDAGLVLAPDGPLFCGGDVGPMSPYLPSGIYL